MLFIDLTYFLCFFLVLTCLLLFQETHEIDVLMTNDDVLGDEISRDQQDAMRHFCYQTLRLGVGVGSSNTSLISNVCGFTLLYLRSKNLSFGNWMFALFL